ncbi:hypothetical protein OG21DRAFT_1425232 [Imleria badia]|nr:hypothetical protein OG21DRAFT_1425232 [Imleria badia]
MYRCRNCIAVDLYCKGCLLVAHAAQPVHMINEWTGEYWIQKPLKDLGVIIQLGHPIGETCCLLKVPYADDFTVLNGNGVHPMALWFCGCESANTPVQQLLCHRLFPASMHQPRTAATFALLEEFHLLSLESKISAYHFYTSLARHTSNTGLSPLKVCCIVNISGITHFGYMTHRIGTSNL